MLWVFEGKPELNLDEMLQGRSAVPALAHVAGGDNAERQLLSPSVNVVLVHLHNRGKNAVTTAPEFVVESPDAAKPPVEQGIAFGGWTLTGTEPFAEAVTEAGEKNKATLRFASKELAPGEERIVAASLWREAKADEVPRTAEEAVALRDKAANYWQIARFALRPHSRARQRHPEHYRCERSRHRTEPRLQERRAGLSGRADHLS